MLIASYLESMASTGGTVKAIVIGLGVGLLPMFLHGCLSFLSIEVVELDPVILDLARDYFYFRENEHLKNKSLKNLSDQNCEIFTDNVGATVIGETFVACNVCACPVCRSCYEYEWKHGNQSCPQCKTRYQRLQEEDCNAATDFHYPSENQNEKQKVVQRIMSWRMTYGSGDDSRTPNYVKEVSRNYSSLLTNGIEVFLGQSGGLDIEGNELPRLVYVSHEKRPGFQHHKKVGSMNTLALREAMCFMMDPNLGKYVCYVQFPQRFDGIDRNDRYANRKTVFFDINLRGLDGIQGPVYVGTGCVFNRTPLYGYERPLKPKNKRPGFFSSLCGESRKRITRKVQTK